MDSAEARSIQGVLESNNARMDRQEEQMFATGRAVQALVAQGVRAPPLKFNI